MDNIKQCMRDVMNCIVDNSKCPDQSVDEKGCVSIGAFTISPVSLKILIESLSTKYSIVDINTSISILCNANIIRFNGKFDGYYNSVSITETGCKLFVDSIF